MCKLNQFLLVDNLKLQDPHSIEIPTNFDYKAYCDEIKDTFSKFKSRYEQLKSPEIMDQFYLDAEFFMDINISRGKNKLEISRVKILNIYKTHSISNFVRDISSFARDVESKAIYSLNIFFVYFLR